ncbi:hypothetical protein [Bradyrhizobium japonicum]|uniref:hypothetical protein n=1 Tax=Bradyrhizobium japonicum TaxID=375 RepID=UPI0004B9D854|nr:hypothetical protein [Bradyrhizobium japonicum]
MIAPHAAMISVLSVIVPFAQNYIINPRHKDAARIRASHVAPYPHDPRLFGQRTGGVWSAATAPPMLLALDLETAETRRVIGCVNISGLVCSSSAM